MHIIEKQIIAEELIFKTWKLYELVYDLDNVPIPTYDFQCRGINTAGHYQPKWNGNKATVMINLAYYHGGNTSNLEQTIAHEIAHHITKCIYPKAIQWHGPEFKSVMQSIGFNGSTYHSMNVKMARSEAIKAKNDLFDL